MNVLITAGGTAERIDSVRSVVNFATGKLGSLIADYFAESPKAEKIFYICGKNAVQQTTTKAKILPIETVDELENAVRKVFRENRVDAIVHSMAVGDFQMRAATNARLLAESIWKAKPKTQNELEKLIANAGGFYYGGKISSNEENLILLFKQAPKIISLFRELSPRSLLIGFKLLDGVPLETLIDAAYSSIMKNGCEYVLANDLQDVASEKHIGYLIDRTKNARKYEGKEQIARGIVEEVFRKV
ncbi:MAG: hypothetical protein LBL99_04610 [Holosporaceae bacterium]|nr:hypothetical protein [Holosporaceae bacterium]